MAYQVSTINTVEFDGKPFPIEMTAELRLRLGQLNFDSEEATAEADRILSECFGTKASEVAKLLPKVAVLDKQFLRAYLTGGQKAVDILNSELTRTVEKGLEK